MAFEIDFLQAGSGNGDAICLRYGAPETGFTIHVVDGGFSYTGDELVKHINLHYRWPGHIDHVVLSHADNDHAAGLIKVVEQFSVGTLWINRPWQHVPAVQQHFHGNWTAQGLRNEMRNAHSYVTDLEDIASKKGIPIKDVFQGTTIGAFTVLAPSFDRYIGLIPQLDKTPKPYIKEGALAKAIGAIAKAVTRYAEDWGIETLSENPDPTSASNESSLVQCAFIDDKLIVLTGDVGPDGLHEARDYFELLYPNLTVDMIQVPHHGSRRNVTPSALDRWLGPKTGAPGTKRGVAACSIGSDQHDYPRRRVSNAFLRRGYPVATTIGGTVSYSKNSPQRAGYGPVSFIPFEHEFEE